jgi:actin-like ATPase involved in cell morphogenesis
VADDLMVEALRPVKDGIATVAEVTEAMMKILLE